MILNHNDGLERIYSLRKQYEIELELVCLNSEFKDITTLIPQAQQFYLTFSDRVVFKESETNELDYPYYEISIFCQKDEIERYQTEIINHGLALDIIHETKDCWIP